MKTKNRKYLIYILSFFINNISCNNIIYAQTNNIDSIKVFANDIYVNTCFKLSPEWVILGCDTTITFSRKKENLNKIQGMLSEIEFWFKSNRQQIENRNKYSMDVRIVLLLYFDNHIDIISISRFYIAFNDLVYEISDNFALQKINELLKAVGLKFIIADFHDFHSVH